MKEEFATVIEKEIRKFLSQYYKKEERLARQWNDFLKKNDLFIPYRDHTYYLDILLEAYNYLRNIVQLFAPELVRKMKHDIIEIDHTLTYMQANKIDISLLYKSFLKKSEVFKTIEQSNEFSIYYKDLQEIFFVLFEEIVYQYTASIEADLKSILNHKTVMFEHVLWEEANKFQRIRSSTICRNIYKLDTKSYLHYRLTILNPYSEKYERMKKLLGELE